MCWSMRAGLLAASARTYASGLSPGVKWAAGILMTVALVTQVWGVLLIVQGIRDDLKAAYEVVKSMPRTPFTGNLHPTTKDRILERHERHTAAWLGSSFGKALAGNVPQRWLGVGLLIVGIVAGFAGSLVALLA
jgi:hypothetical protein